MAKDKSCEEDDFQCAAEQALGDFQKQETDRLKATEARKAEKSEKNKVWAAAQWIILIVCIGIMTFQIPKLISTFSKKEKPHRTGTYETDARTDTCIRNLWQVSRILQQGKLPGKELLCPASNKPFVIVKTIDDIIVRSPNPELYGLKDIRVSKKRPVPEVVN